jgi:hypothetical protein
MLHCQPTIESEPEPEVTNNVLRGTKAPRNISANDPRPNLTNPGSVQLGPRDQHNPGRALFVLGMLALEGVTVLDICCPSHYLIGKMRWARVLSRAFSVSGLKGQ